VTPLEGVRGFEGGDQVVDRGVLAPPLAAETLAAAEPGALQHLGAGRPGVPLGSRSASATISQMRAAGAEMFRSLAISIIATPPPNPFQHELYIVRRAEPIASRTVRPIVRTALAGPAQGRHRRPLPARAPAAPSRP